MAAPLGGMTLPRDETQDATAEGSYNPEDALLDIEGDDSNTVDTADITGNFKNMLDSSYSDVEPAENPLRSSKTHQVSYDSEQENSESMNSTSGFATNDTPTRELQKSAAALQISNSQVPDSVPTGIQTLKEKLPAEQSEIPDTAPKRIPEARADSFPDSGPKSIPDSRTKSSLSNLMKKKQDKESQSLDIDVISPSETYKKIMEAKLSKEKVPVIGNLESFPENDCGSFYNRGDGRIGRCLVKEDVSNLSVSSLSFDPKTLLCHACPKSHYYTSPLPMSYSC